MMKDSSPILRDMAFSLDRNSLYVMSENQVRKMRSPATEEAEATKCVRADGSRRPLTANISQAVAACVLCLVWSKKNLNQIKAVKGIVLLLRNIQYSNIQSKCTHGGTNAVSNNSYPPPPRRQKKKRKDLIGSNLSGCCKKTRLRLFFFSFPFPPAQIPTLKPDLLLGN